jgi:hypothetical protein
MLFIQVVQLFLITTLPLLLPSFPALVGDHLGIMQVLLDTVSISKGGERGGKER